MTFENEFFKDQLTKQTLDEEIEDNCETETRWVRLRDVYDVDAGEPVFLDIAEVNFMAIELTKADKLKLRKLLAGIIVSCCAIAFKNGITDLRQDIKEALLKRKVKENAQQPV